MLLLRFDGSSWSTVTKSLPSYQSPPAIFALAQNDVLISGETGVDNSGEIPLGVYTLTRVTNGVVTRITSWEPGQYISLATPATMWAFSTSDVYLPGFPVYHWNGTTATQVGGDQAANHIWAASPSAIFSDANSASELESGSWFALDPGASQVLGLTGTAANRVFVVGGDGSVAHSGFVVIYDGVGWTRQTVPSTTGTLYAAWAATTGQVFAVGANGSILEGP